MSALRITLSCVADGSHTGPGAKRARSSRVAAIVTVVALSTGILAYLTSPLPAAAQAAEGNNRGYTLVASDGGIFAFGDALFRGSTGAIPLNRPIVGMAPTPTGTGYWLVASDGGIFAFGDARFLGSTGAIPLNRPIVGMASTPTGNGYWLVASDGGIFAFGDARFLGSTGALRLAQPIVGMAATPTGNGYRLVARDGGVFAFGDAGFLGSTGSLRLAQPIVGLASSPTGKGYWLVASDGGIFAFGDSRFLGSTGAIRLNRPVVGMAASRTGGGYWLVASDGGIFAFGDARFFGSTGALRLNQPIVGMAAPPPQPVVADLIDLEQVVRSGAVVEGPRTVNGKRYEKSLSISPSVCCTSATDYDLARNFRSFQAVVGLGDTSPTAGRAVIEIFADGRSIFRATVPIGTETPINLDVTNVLRLRFEASTDTTSVDAVIGNGRLTDLPAPSPGDPLAPVVTFLTDFDQVAGSAAEGTDFMQQKIFPHSITLLVSPFSSHGTTRSVEYSISRSFPRLTATLGLSEDTASGASATIEVFGDGRNLATHTLTVGALQPIDLDVTGVLRLRLVATLVGTKGAEAIIGDARLLNR